ncbi:membrane-associating domain-containing protein [Pseudomassariella vexata]|uniref:Membrane-associating domain-domain-containing protein n=1 Tax=Pseudomassariella vexata TaxID=1141098 RepID=A0A1Y2EGE2_9PEZI|nr:membrane-associating domain-containing protein [Pseudomassariella vexata]ORY70374.1 membrane-associating domain-domain-containing protein [Pseudomassariella vexata]
MAAGYLPIVYGIAAVFAIVELGLTAYMASWFHSYYWDGDYTPSIVSFLVFNSVWSLLVLAYVGITPIYMASVFRKLAALALNVITAIFWFAGAIALAVYVGTPSCYGSNRCQSSQAAVAFAFFLWVLFTFLAVLDALEALRSRGHNTGARIGSKPTPYSGA